MFTRNVVIDGRRTTVRLEASIWSALDEICVNERMTRHDLCTRIERARGRANRAQAIRATVVSYYRTALKVGRTGPDLVERAINGGEDFVA